MLRSWDRILANALKRAWPKLLKKGKISIGIRWNFDLTIILSNLRSFEHGDLTCSKMTLILITEQDSPSYKIINNPAYWTTTRRFMLLLSIFQVVAQQQAYKLTNIQICVDLILLLANWVGNIQWLMTHLNVEFVFGGAKSFTQWNFIIRQIITYTQLYRSR